MYPVIGRRERAGKAAESATMEMSSDTTLGLLAMCTFNARAAKHAEILQDADAHHRSSTTEHWTLHSIVIDGKTREY